MKIPAGQSDMLSSAAKLPAVDSVLSEECDSFIPEPVVAKLGILFAFYSHFFLKLLWFQ